MPSYWPNIQAGGWGAAIGGGLTSGVNAMKGITDIEGDVQKQAIQKDVAERVKKEYEEGQMPVPVDKVLGMFAPQYHKPITEMMQTENIIEKMGDKEVVRKVHFKEFVKDLEKSDIKKALMVKAGQNQVREANQIMQSEYDIINPVYEDWEKSWKDKLDRAVNPETGVVDMKKQSDIKKQMADDKEYNEIKQQREEIVKHLQATEIAEREEQKRMNILDLKHQERIAKGMSREDIADVEWGRKSEEEVLMKIKRREAQLTAEAYMNKTRAGETIKSEVKSKEPTPDMKLVEAWHKEKNPAKKAQLGKLIEKKGFIRPETPEKPAKITANVATNPITQRDEYLMTDGTFSGKVAAAKPKAGTAGFGPRVPTTATPNTLLDKL